MVIVPLSKSALLALRMLCPIILPVLRTIALLRVGILLVVALGSRTMTRCPLVLLLDMAHVGSSWRLVCRGLIVCHSVFLSLLCSDCSIAAEVASRHESRSCRSGLAMEVMRLPGQGTCMRFQKRRTIRCARPEVMHRRELLSEV